jgi:AcrR family transcriptional regulator
MKETEKKIYDSGKKHFYEDGYYKATIRDIAQTAEVNSGLFNYYYKNKYNLAKQIFNEIYSNIRKLVSEYMSDEEDPIIIAGMVLRIHTHLLYNDKIIEFTMGALKEGVIEESRLENGKTIVRNINDYLGKDFSEEQTHLLLAITLAAEKTTLNQKYAGNLDYDLKRIADVVLKVFLNGYDLSNDDFRHYRDILHEKYEKLCTEFPDYINRII